MEKVYVALLETKNYLVDNNGVYLLTEQSDIATESKAIAVYTDLTEKEEEIFKVKLTEINFERPIEIGYVSHSSPNITAIVDDYAKGDHKVSFQSFGAPIDDSYVLYPKELEKYVECSGFKSSIEWVRALIEYLCHAGIPLKINQTMKLHLYALENINRKKSEAWLRSRMLLKIGF